MRNRTSVVHRKLDKTYPVAVSGKGVHIFDEAGRRYIDACGGAAVSSVGHNHPVVVEALRRALDAIDYTHGSFFTNPALEELAHELVSSAPPGMGHIAPFGGGSEAMESALKLARQAAVERGQPGRSIVISRRQSYHGNTLGALSISGNEGRRATYAPLLFPARFVDPCFAFRYARPDESEDAYGHRAADALEHAIIEASPANVLAFVAETVVGATSGAVVPARGYFKRVREICDRHGVTLILDEVMCGMGRTGTLHACTQEGVAPDLMVVAKGLGGGAVPIAAVYVSDAIYAALEAGSGTLQNGFTYMGHPLACAGALAVQKLIRETDLVRNVGAQGERLMKGLGGALGGHAHVGDIRGRGLFVAVEFVRERATNEPFDPAFRLHERAQRACAEEGLLVYAMPGTIDGKCGDHIMLAPPYIVDDATTDEIVALLARALARAF